MADRHQAVPFDASWRANLQQAVNAFYLPQDFDDATVYGELQTAYDNWQANGGTDGFEVHAVYDDATNVLVEVQLLAAMNVEAGSDGITFWQSMVPPQETLKGWVDAGLALASVEKVEAAYEPAPPPVAAAPATLDEAWADDGWRTMFAEWATSMLMGENVAFIEAAQGFQAAPSAGKAWEVVDRFVGDSAPEQINIDDSMVQEILATLPARQGFNWQRGQVPADVFDGAVEHCWQLLKEAYPRFRTAWS